MSNQSAATAAKKQSKALQLVLALLFLAGFAVLAFLPDAAGFKGDSFFDLITRLFRDGAASLGKFAGAAMFGVLGFYAALIVLTVVSFFVKGKGALVLNYVKAVLAVLTFALFALALRQDGTAGFAAILTDVNAVLFSLALAVLYVVVLNFSAYGRYGIVKCLLFLIAAAFFAFYSFVFVNGLKLSGLFTFGLDLGAKTSEKIASYAFMALAFGAVVNAGLAGLDLIIPRTGALDLIRSIVFFIIAAFAFVMLAVLTSFKDISDNLGTICFLGLAALQGIVVIIVNALNKRAAQRRESEDGAFVFDENDQMAIKGFEPAAETEPQAAEETPKASSALDDAAQISIEDIVNETQAETETAASAAEAEPLDEAQEPEPVIEPLEEEPAYEGEPQEEKPFNFEQAQYDGQFNREYADFARRQEQTQETPREQAQQQPNNERQAQQPDGGFAGYQQQQQQQPNSGYNNYQQQAPYTYGQGYAQQFAQNYGMPYFGGAVPYLPDAFINSLTPQEKDEFDRLFISRIYGENKRLPMYQVGGDNREFFSKVFVFIGRYRNVISDGLLEKIYNQSNLLK